MISATITARRPGRWWRREKEVTWVRRIPERWEDVPERRRRHYYRTLLLPNGVRSVAGQLLGLPAWAIRAMKPEQWAALTGQLAWMQPKPDCVHLPFTSFEHRGITYYMPEAKGANIACLEYPIADEYLTEFVEKERDSALILLTATICRETHPDRAMRLRRHDNRAPLYSRGEIEERAERLRKLPIEYQMAAMLYFAGLKEYIHRTYGPWLFDDDDQDEDADPKTTTAPKGPDFGWWGVYQDVAEAGLFGTLEQVYQTSFHDVAMWLVRQTVKADAMRTSTTPAQPKEDDDLL